MSKNNKKSPGTPQFERAVEKHFYELDQKFPSPNWGYAVGMLLLFFGVMGLIWMIPFPQLAFLERMNAQTFLNWGSFFIAIVVYVYLSLAPTLSYAVLFCIGILSFLIVQVEYLERDYGVSAVLIFAVVTAIAIPLLYLVLRNDKKDLSVSDFFKFLGYGPIWLWSKAFDRLKWKY